MKKIVLPIIIILVLIVFLVILVETIGSNTTTYLIWFVISFWFITIIITITLAVSKGYSGFLAFLLGLFIPLLGSLIVIALLPDKNKLDLVVRYVNKLSPEKKERKEGGKKNNLQVCKKCGEEIDSFYSSCPHCGSNELV